MFRKQLSLLYPLGAILLWAGNVIASRLSAHVIGPQAMTFYRLLLAVMLMSVFVARPAWRNRATIGRHLGQFFLLGFMAMCLFQSLSYLAAESTTATNMAVFTALTPLLTIGLSALLLREKIGVSVVAGGSIALFGVIYLVSAGAPMTLIHGGVGLGDLLMFMAATIYALYGVLLKRWDLPVRGWQSTYMQALCALLIMFPALLATPAPLRQLDQQTIPLILYAGGMASVVLPFLWIRGIELLGPARCSIAMYLLPIFTAVGAAAMLGEPMRSYHLIGVAVVLTGVAVAQWAQQKRMGRCLAQVRIAPQ